VRFALVLLFAGNAAAATVEQIRARGRLVVSVKSEGAAAPLSHHDPAHFQKRNFELAIARAIAKKVLGDADKLELKQMPRAVRLHAVAEDRVDLCISMIAVTEERRLQVDFSRPYFTDGLALLTRDQKMRSLAGLAGKRLLALRQTANDPAAELKRRASARGAQFSLERVGSFAEGAERIAAGTADGLVSHAANIEAWLPTHPGFSRTPLLLREDFAVALKKGNAPLRRLVDEAIDELERSGALLALQKQAGLTDSLGAGVVPE
jgi:putative glutamine transport system substrate-binding protein